MKFPKPDIALSFNTEPARSLKYFIPVLVLLILGMSNFEASAQGAPFPPPREISVFATQDLMFGEFFTGEAGGTVVVSPSGIRSSTGTVVLIGGHSQPAIFIVELLPGRLVHILINPQTIILNRTGGGGTMSMSIGPPDKGTSFITHGGHPFRNPVQVGGTLHVGAITSNPPGDYHGTFHVTFIQE